MKFYKKGSEVFAFEDDGTQDKLITKDHVKMSDEEIDKHLNPEKYLTDEQKRDLYLKSLKPLTRRQFKLALVKSGLNLSDIESKINELDNQELLIEWEDATEFERLNPSLLLMCEVLELNETKVDELWEFGLTL